DAVANEYISTEILATADKIKYLSDYLLAVNAKSMIIELDYVDGDYLDDFSNYYVKCFKSYQRKCKRLHFFAKDLSADHVSALVAESARVDDVEKLQGAYLGFLVARPLPNAVIGRTVLKTYPSDSGR